MVDQQTESVHRDFIKPVAIIFLMCVLLWVALDIARVALAQRAVANDVNEAMALTEDGAYLRAMHRLQQAEEKRLRSRGKTAHFWMEKVRPFDSEMQRRLSDAHKALAIRFSDERFAALAERHYTLALLHDPEAAGLTGRLATEAFYTKNYELGWVAIQIAKNDPRSRTPQPLVRFFEDNYTGPRHRFDE